MTKSNGRSPDHTSQKPRAQITILESFRVAAARTAIKHGVTLRRAKQTKRRWFINPTYAGLAITLVVLIAAGQGWLDGVEHELYDARTRYCQVGRPAPTTQLVHVDIDDKAVNAIGRWPWSRQVQAQLVEELAAAKPKAVCFDILYSESQDIYWKDREGNPAERVDSDTEFEKALRHLGCGIIAYSFDAEIEPNRPLIFQQIKNKFFAKPTLTVEELTAGMSPEDARTASTLFFVARTEAIQRRVFLALTSGVLTPGEQDLENLGHAATQPAVATTLPTTRPAIEALRRAIAGESTTVSPAARAVDDAYLYVTGRMALAPYRVNAGETGANLMNRPMNVVPLERMTKAAGYAAFATDIKSSDGVVREMPVLANLDGRAGIGLGVALALKTLDADLKDIRVTADRLTIPTPSGDRVMPIHLRQSYIDRRDISAMMDVPWFGPAGDGAWQRMYDRNAVKNDGIGTQHVSLASIWDSIESRSRLAANNASLRGSYLTLLGSASNDQAQFAAAEHASWDPYDASFWTARAEALMASEAYKFAVDSYRETKPAELPPEERERQKVVLAAAHAMPDLIRQTRDLEAQSTKLRADLAKHLGGKSILFGFTAIGLGDTVPTPLHPACPGVIVHGVVFNAIMTNAFLKTAPGWLTLAVTAVFGVLITLTAARFSPGVAAIIAVSLAATYILLNGIVLFGYGRYILGLAAPLTAVACTWAAGSILQFILEQRERKRITRRFSRYVDPQLVNYFLENPDQMAVAGERRSMTVCFTDLAGFTTLAEKLGEQTVGMLNEYFAIMVPLIRKHKGYLNKLLGDGMMFFFNAPQPNERHAVNALEAVLEMQEALADFNRALSERNLPTVKMRVGITTGDMIVGDAGGVDYSDYTVLGDVVNLGARLEGANKASGTLVLCNRAARDATADEFLTRPVGLLQVVGKSEGIETFEVICRKADATPAKIDLAQRTTEMVKYFREGDLDHCCEVATSIEHDFGPSRLPSLYRDLCDRMRLNGVPEGFNGTVVLETK